MEAENRYAGLILIVDDVPTNLQLLGNLLRDQKYDVMFATSGTQALAMVNKRKPDLILLDVMMPEMDGFSVCQALQSQEHTSDIPVLFLTALKEHSDILRGFECGAVDYVSKPFHHVELIARVNTHISLLKTRKRLESANAELTAANIAKDRFFSILAHDLRGPFTVFLSVSELLLMQVKGGQWEKLMVTAQNLHSQVRRFYSLLEGLLEWGSLQRKRVSCQIEPLQVQFEIQAVVNHCLDMASEKAVKIELEVENLRLLADRHMLRAVLRNLITNAIKFSQKNQVITVEAKARGQEAVISVKDQGVGISAEIKEQLFRIDCVVSTAGTNDEKGTGLGLILCQEYVQKMNGRIQVTSTLGQGANFMVTLPLA